jgi:hypothetical protein
MSSYSQMSGHMIRRHLFTVEPLAAAATEDQPSSLADDLKLFATFWLGGVVFFGTFLA